MSEQILTANGANFVSTTPNGNWQPMVLNAWTQTISEDFELMRCLQHEPQIESENRALREKVRYLESKLQEHTELLTQIHQTSARMQQVPATPPPPPIQQQLLTPPSSVIMPQSMQRTEVIDYKIIAGADCNDADAIEIRLAAESLNSLSSSADSERLEICLNESIKNEQATSRQNNKRLKLEPSAPQQAYKLPPRKSLQPSQLSDVMVSIGPNNTCVPAHVFENINWSTSSLATRKLLVAIFDRETLATHSMTGKPSPAFKDQHKPLKQMLDPLKIQDIIFAVTRKSNATEKEVRNAITTKCADENKMLKIQKGKRCSLGDKENMR